MSDDLMRERVRESIAEFMREMGWEDYDAMLPDMLTSHVADFVQAELRRLGASGMDVEGRCISTLGDIRCEKSFDHEHDHMGRDSIGKVHEWVSWPAKTARFSCALCGLNTPEPCQHWLEVLARKHIAQPAARKRNADSLNGQERSNP